MIRKQRSSSTSVRQPKKRRSLLVILFGLATFILIFSLAALIIAFAVESSWFGDGYDKNATGTNETYYNHYGLWRLCFYANNTCGSWFSSGEAYTGHIDGRLNQAKVGINAWQALEIVYLFLVGSTWIIAMIALIFYICSNSVHYYLSILVVFCIWPSVCVGIAGLFVFGFSVYNVAKDPKYLDWCFYLNLASVILAFISAILFTIYDLIIKRPRKSLPNETVIATFPDIYTQPGITGTPTFAAFQPKRNQRERPYEYSERQNPYQHVRSGSPYDRTPLPDYDMDTGGQKFVPYSSGTTYQQRNPMADQIRGMPSGQPYSYPVDEQWRRTEPNFGNPAMRTYGDGNFAYSPQGPYRPPPLDSYGINPNVRSQYDYPPTRMFGQQPPYMASPYPTQRPPNSYC